MATNLSAVVVSELRRPDLESPRKDASSAGAVKPDEQQSSQALEKQAVEKSEGVKLEDSVRVLNEFVQTSRRNLQFSIDDESGRSVIKVLDAETDEVIRQIPADELLAMSQRLQAQLEEQGVIFQALA